MAAKTKLVKWQKTREIITKKKYSGESSPYGEWVDKHSKKEEGESQEFPQANPDVLPFEEQQVSSRKILENALVELKFSPKEQEILNLLAKGLSQTQIAKKLGVTQARIGGAMARIRKKGLAWYGYKAVNHDDIMG